MNDSELKRLYLLYKAGSVKDGRKNSDLLQVAKATANDLSEDEFSWLSKEVEQLGSTRDSQASEKGNATGIERTGEKEWSVWQAAKSFATGSGDYQKRLSELPDLVRSTDKPFSPTRLADGNPIDLDPTDPEASQERLKAQPYSQVKHDPKLRDAWHAAQSGKFADMLRGNDVWQAYTDPSLLKEGAESNQPVRSSLSAPLRSLLSSMDAGELDTRMSRSESSFGRDLPSYTVYKEDPNKVVRELMQGEQNIQHYARSSGADDIPTKTSFKSVFEERGGRNEEDVRKWVHEVREHHEKTVRQKLVDYQVAGYRPSVAQQANEVQAASQPIAVNPGAPAGKVNPTVAAPPIDLRTTARQNAANPVQGIVEDPLNLPGDGKKSGGGLMDMLQIGLDGLGVADPTPIVDGVNAGISVVRAFTDPKNAGTHLVNAGISAVSMVPYIGDIAKVFKYGGKAVKAGKLGKKTAESGVWKDSWGKSGIPRKMEGGIGGVIGNIAGGLFGGGGGGSGNGGGGNDSAESDGTSGESSGGGSGWGSLLGIAAAAIGITGAFRALGSWINRTVANGEKLLDSQRNLARYSGELTNAFSLAATRDVFREMREAKYLGGSASGLAGAQSGLKDATSFRDAPWKRLSNDIANLAAQVATVGVYIQALTSPLGLIVRGLYQVKDAVLGNKDDDAKNVVDLFAKQEADKLAAAAAAAAAAANPPAPKKRLPADGQRK